MVYEPLGLQLRGLERGSRVSKGLKVEAREGA